MAKQTQVNGSAAIKGAVQQAASQENTDPLVELMQLRGIVKAAELSLESGEEHYPLSPASVLREAMRAASEDFEMATHAANGPTGVPALFLLRAERRLDLALKLSHYRESYGYLNANPGYQGTIPPLNLNRGAS